MKKWNKGFFVLALSVVAVFATASVATAAVDKVRCVLWQGDPAKYHTAIDGQSVRLAGVITTTDTGTIWYQWVFGDGSPASGVTALSGSMKYNVSVDHTYTGAVGTPFMAQLLVDSVDSSMANAVGDTFLAKIEDNNLDARVNIAIDKGLWYLYTTQWTDSYTHSLTGELVTVWSSYSSCFASPSASAVLAFEINNHKETGDTNEDPYVETVEKGLNWLFTGYYYSTSYPMLQAISIGPQTYGDPEAGQASPNGIGIQVRDYTSYPPYEGGMIMDAIIASGTPNADSGRDFDGDGFNDTYQEVIQDMVDMYAWGQGDDMSGYHSRGGWRYWWNYGDSDNSACQWAAIGMIPAENDWSCTIPGWVKVQNDYWLSYSYNSSYLMFGYTYSGAWGNSSSIATRPSGMVQMVMSVNNYNTDSRWIGAESWFANTSNWNWFIGNRTYYGWYAFVKAMRLSNTDTLSNGFDWYRGSNGIAGKLLVEQEGDGSWPSSGQVTHPGYYGDTFVTAWAIGMLRPALFAAAPIACFTANPNPTFPGVPVTFDPSCSDHSETGKDITNLVLFEWDWDDDGIYDASTATPVEVTHVFSCAVLPCTYPVTLRVTDDAALTATFSLNINVTQPPHPPTADANGSYMVSLCAGDSLTLDGSGSSDIDEGQHEAGCPACPDDTITAWDWDLTPPLTGFDDESGETVTLDSTAIGYYFSAGDHNVGLQVSDNTALSFPTSGSPNLTDADFAVVTVYDPCACDLGAVAKDRKIQLSWSVTGAASYDIYRSTAGPNTGFVLIANDFVTAYGIYQDATVSNGTTYWYRVVSSDGCGSLAASGTPVARSRGRR